jgi:hypothetical protein
LPNSSLFSKIGSDIISSSQLNFNNHVGPTKKTQNIPSVIVQNYNKTPLNNHPNSKINFNNLNNLNNINNFNNINNINSILNSNLGVSYKDKEKEKEKSSLSPLSKEKKYLTNISNRNNYTNKKMYSNSNKTLEKSNSSNELTQSIHNHIQNFQPIQERKDMMIEHLSEGITNLDLSLNKQQIENVITITDDAIDLHAYIWEFLFDLEFHFDNKSMLVSSSKNIIYKYEELVRRNITWEIFNNNNSLNKTYTKILKIAIIIMIYYKFVLIDFNFETNIKTNLKKIALSLNEQLINFIEAFVLIKDTVTEKLPKEFMDKLSKCVKNHKIKKSKEPINININMNMNMNCLNIFKSLELVINNVKQFSNNFFKIGYFKPIHTICFDLFKFIESMSLNSLTNLVVNHVLFYPLNMFREKNGISNKALIFSPVSFLGVSNHSQTPFLPPVGGDVYTLFLDLDETLVHFFFVI